VNLPTNESLPRWVLNGLPLLVGIGVVVGLALRISFGLPFARIATPITVLVAIQGALFISMYWVRQRYKRKPDLRGGIILFGSYGLLIGLAGMHYAGQLGIVGVNTLNENYLGFSVYVLVVTAVAVGLFSFLKPTRIR
jgi:NO-binding membrane sensor protein with MHYT domain